LITPGTMQTSNKRESFGEITGGATPVLVDFFAEWCGPCKMMKPILEQLHQRMGNRVRILKIDIDKSPSAAAAYGVQSVPTLLLFQQGKVLWRQSGVLQASQLEKIIEQHI
jgi:thioredoxin 1